ncbi:Alpha/beta-Hydrolases superfamily protein [Dorcoceras hygrometricum]|uniref:Alpha/beta-Hydrolases superfamily protein n=1 Tax=Dorcoceras hygrometricum TaxID=472368 RepID=A0A2Z7CQL0_9LAMI|nr:Alpha/beta-Hydrolases superfamily protein [Dorcoceras hygrometricum]
MRISSVRPCTSSNPVTTPQLEQAIAINTRRPTKKKQVKVGLTGSKKNSVKCGYIGSIDGSLMEAGKVSKRWREYQGIKNWEGLLDPLDENLRREIIRYGNFIQATYHSYNLDISSPSYGTCRYPKRSLLDDSGFRETGYRVCRNLTANSGIRLPRWMPAWMAMQSSWIGYVAVCQNKKEIARLGRRDVVIALRGTVTCLEWLENLRATLTPIPGTCGYSCPESEVPMVESGFLSLYTSTFENRPSLQTLLNHEISRILEKYGDEPLSFTITGHSLGAALATVAAYDIKKTFGNSPLVTVISFAGPRVGNWSFRCELEKQGTKILRIVNSDDLITKVPGFVRENNQQTLFSDNFPANTAAAGLGGWVQKLVEDMQWVYADVGCELRLSSRDSPYLSGGNIATCHDLKTYLHLVDGFVGSNCPFRATARKIINKNLGTG